MLVCEQIKSNPNTNKLAGPYYFIDNHFTDSTFHRQLTTKKDKFEIMLVIFVGEMIVDEMIASLNLRQVIAC